MTNDDTPRFDERITVRIAGEDVEYVRPRPRRLRCVSATSAVGAVAGLYLVDAFLGTPFAVATAVALVALSTFALIFGD